MSSDISSLPFPVPHSPPPPAHTQKSPFHASTISRDVRHFNRQLCLQNRSQARSHQQTPHQPHSLGACPSTFNDLHHAVQAAFEWSKSHAYEFSNLSSTRLLYNGKIERAQTSQSDKPILTRPHYEYPANLGHLQEGLWRLTSEQPCRRHMILSKELNDRHCLRHSGILPATVVDAPTE